jgi:hypothetical protein
MHCYKDKSFCNVGHLCANKDCHRILKEEDLKLIKEKNIPVCYCGACEKFKKIEDN